MAAAVELATPADPARSSVSTMKISKARISGGIVSTSWYIANATHVSQSLAYFASVEGRMLLFSIASTLVELRDPASLSSDTVLNSSNSKLLSRRPIYLDLVLIPSATTTCKG
jgi:hypothetical protein